MGYRTLKTEEHRSDPRALLEAFLASNRSGKAFAALVESLSRLVFSRALRRTGNPQLAEEITQDVFAILARKAESLRHHPALEAWIFETTRLRAASAMRSERRRQRKIAALTSESQARHPDPTDPMDNQATWKEAVPALDEALDRLPVKERNIILQRFYDGKKFREIAAASGLTEGACKKRVKRTLEKLSRILSARGVTLSVTGIASLLGTELARSAPVQSAAVLAPKALAASSSLSTTTLFANTIQTMSNLKTTTITAAIVLAIAAVPFSQQLAEGGRLKSELKAASGQGAGLESAFRGSKSERSKQTRKTESAGIRTPASLLASLNSPFDNHALIRALMADDALEESTAWGRIAGMNPEELKRLLDDVQGFPCDGDSKDQLTQMLDSYGPELPPRDQLERVVAGGRQSSTERPMLKWAASEPEAALKWYREKRASGELDPGLDDKLHETVLTSLVRGLATSRPETAFELYRDSPKKEMHEWTPMWLSSELAKHIIETGDKTHLVKMLEIHSGTDRSSVLVGTFGEFARQGKFDEGMALVDEYNTAPEDRTAYLGCLFGSSGLGLHQIRGGLDWVLSATPEDEAPEVIGTIIAGYFSGRRFAADEWLAEQDAGPVRDRGYAALIDSRLDVSQFKEALGNAGQIDDAALRAATRQMIGRKWLEKDRKKAEEGLPADLLEQLQNQ